MVLSVLQITGDLQISWKDLLLHHATTVLQVGCEDSVVARFGLEFGTCSPLKEGNGMVVNTQASGTTLCRDNKVDDGERSGI